MHSEIQIERRTPVPQTGPGVPIVEGLQEGCTPAQSELLARKGVPKVIGAAAVQANIVDNYLDRDLRFWRQKVDGVAGVYNEAGDEMVDSLWSSRPADFISEKAATDEASAKAAGTEAVNAATFESNAKVTEKPVQVVKDETSLTTGPSQTSEGTRRARSIPGEVKTDDEPTFDQIVWPSGKPQAQTSDRRGVLRRLRSGMVAFKELLTSKFAGSTEITDQGGQANTTGGNPKRAPGILRNAWSSLKKGYQEARYRVNNNPTFQILTGGEPATDTLESFFSHPAESVSSEREKLIHPQYDWAARITDDEIVRDRGNGGEPINETYRNNNQNVRTFLVESFKDGRLYRSPKAFENVIRKAHVLAAADNVYEQVSKGKYRLDDSAIGVTREGNVANHRWGQSHRASGMSSVVEGAIGAYHRAGVDAPIKSAPTNPRDQYGGRFQDLEPGQTSRYDLRLEGISEGNQPFDTIRADDKGRPIGDTYTYYYPPKEAAGEYYARAQAIGAAIHESIASGVTVEKIPVVIGLIAQQYQYLAIARPFKQINNSLFMNLANMQLKLLGTDGIPHREMDIAAQRMRPDVFKLYFYSKVVGDLGHPIKAADMAKAA